LSEGRGGREGGEGREGGWRIVIPRPEAINFVDGRRQKLSLIVMLKTSAQNHFKIIIEIFFTRELEDTFWVYIFFVIVLVLVQKNFGVE
jgi:hypothetical protein